MEDVKKKLKILHVDDEPDIRSVVKTILEKEGYEVIGVENGLEALKMIKQNGFDLIILDIMMPDMSGWDLFSRIGIIKPNYKVIFLSIIEISQDKLEELREAGIKDYIKKPFDNNDFVRRIHAVTDTVL